MTDGKPCPYTEAAYCILMSPTKQKGIARAYAVSYAFFRVAQVLEVKELKAALSSYGSAVLKDYFEDGFSGLSEKLVSATYFLKMASDTGMIRPGSFEFIAKEIEEFKAVLAELSREVSEREKEAVKELDLTPPKMLYESPKRATEQPKKAKKEEFVSLSEDEDIFSEDGPSDEDIAALEREEEDANEPSEVEEYRPNGNNAPVISAGERFAAMNNGNIRQKAIIARIRQTGNCRVREIQEIFPELSERTIRYDLQKLVEEGSIERVGNGGPATFYRLRKSQSSGFDSDSAYPADATLMVAEGRL